MSGLFIGIFNALSFRINNRKFELDSDRCFGNNVNRRAWFASDVASGVFATLSPSWEERYYSNKINKRL
jgi:hypothetical protein